MDEVDIRAESPAARDEEALIRARKLWGKVYAPPRTAKRQPRIDAGRRHDLGAKGGRPTEVGWLRTRRDATRAIAYQHTLEPLGETAAPEVGVDLWAQNQEPEAKFQIEKRHKRKCDSALSVDIPVDNILADRDFVDQLVEN